MANAAIVAGSGAEDDMWQTLRVSFFTGYGGRALAAREVKSLTVSTGPAASSCFLSIPFLEPLADETAFNIALQAGGPQNAIKLLTRAQVSIFGGDGQTSSPKLAGWILNRHHIFWDGKVFDQLNAEIMDDLWLLSKFKLFGRHEYDPDSGKHYFNAGAKLIFNKYGFKDMIPTDRGPRFTPTENFGFNGDFSHEVYDDPAYGTTGSGIGTTWTPADVLQYIFDTMFVSRNVVLSGPARDFGNLQIPRFVNVPAHIERDLPDRPIRDVNYDGMTVLDAIHDILGRCGAYTFGVRPVGNFFNEVVIYNMNPASFKTIYLPGYDVDTVAAAMNAGDLIKYADIIEDVAPIHQQVNLHGDNPAVEVFASTDATGTGAGLLQRDWTIFEEALYKIYIESKDAGGGKKESQTRFAGANRQWLRVYNAYKVTDWKDIFKGTKYDGSPIAARNGVIYATQLTASNTGNKPSGWQPLPIIVEYKMFANEFKDYKATQDGLSPENRDAIQTHWRPAFAFDRLSLSPDGKTLYLEGLRDAGQTWGVEQPTAAQIADGAELLPAYGTHMKPREIRLNIAVEHDTPANSLDKTDPNKIAGRLAPSAPQLTLQMRSGNLAFVDWLRRNDARPVGEAYMDQNLFLSGFPQRCTAGNELYSDFKGAPGKPDASSRAARMTTAKIAEQNRIHLKGKIVFKGLNPAVVPGLAVQIGGDVMDGLQGVFRAVTYEAELQETHAYFDSPDISPLFELRAPAMPAKVGVSAAVKTPEKTKKDDTYETGKSTIPKKPGGDSGYDDNPSGLAGKDRVGAPGAGAAVDAEHHGRVKGAHDRNQWGKRDDPGGNDMSLFGGRPSSGSINGKTDITDAFAGKPSSGSINGKTDITDSFAGKPNSGSINGKTNIADSLAGKPNSGSSNINASGMFDTRAADAHSNAQSLARDGGAHSNWGGPVTHIGAAQKPAGGDKPGALAGNPMGDALKPKPPASSPGNARGYKKDENGFDIPGSNK